MFQTINFYNGRLVYATQTETYFHYCRVNRNRSADKQLIKFLHRRKRQIV